MKIVQSFWSSNKPLAGRNFGWYSPQHHLMAWTLSCLRLREYYDDVHLYVDANGYEMLVDYLQLPYKEVHLRYSEMEGVPETFWALPKVMTYLEQEEPFLHVDGDVFIWDKFSAEIEKASLVAQNAERGTVYYKGMMDSLRGSLSGVPDYLEVELRNESIGSYNAGILGGCDIPFFKKYARTALSFALENCQAGGKASLNHNFNILFEQILFYTLCKQEGKKVTCRLAETIEDEGYVADNFCDFSAVPHRLTYMHLIGNHKRNQATCDLLGRTLFNEYPEYFIKIANLFKSDHVHYHTRITSLFRQQLAIGPGSVSTGPAPIGDRFYRTSKALADLGGYKETCNTYEELAALTGDCGSPVIQEVFAYESTLTRIFEKYKKVADTELHDIERNANNYFPFFDQPVSQQLETVLCRNAFLEMMEDFCGYDPGTKMFLHAESVSLYGAESISVVCLPGLFYKGYSEVAIDELHYNILSLLEYPLTFRELLLELEECFSEEERVSGSEIIFRLIQHKLKHLFHNKCIFIR